MVFGGWSTSGLKEFADLLDGLNGFVSQFFAEVDLLTPAGLSIENGAGGDGGVQHFFEAEGLCTELYPVAVIGFGASAFVFYRKYPSGNFRFEI